MGTLLCSCGGRHHGDSRAEAGEPELFSVTERPQGGWTIVSVSPFDGSRDSLVVDHPLSRLIVMSTSHYGFLDAIGRTDIIVGVSGPDYIFADRLAAESSDAERTIMTDVGYDSAPDYERIVALRPEVVLTYAVSGVESPFIVRLKQLGIKVLTVNEHLERHPLARAAYIRMFGALTGNMAEADSVLSVVRTNYSAIAESISESGVTPRKVLLNIPYNDQWFVPASDNYLAVMIHDAGGEVLGCEEGKTASTVMSVEKAYSLSKEADCWLNVGWCSSEKDLLGVNPIFSDMLGRIKDNAAGMVPDGFPVVWNDNNRVNAKGGNDIWQGGVVRPDLVLRDLAGILHPTEESYNNEIYYKPII
ncbi:MAG: ABC transporter substrate-binding protein [Bacteroidales bacterium]|nr:ABC transporter substrate-binding protein [Bacteroidales bacterium]